MIHEFLTYYIIFKRGDFKVFLRFVGYAVIKYHREFSGNLTSCLQLTVFLELVFPKAIKTRQLLPTSLQWTSFKFRQNTYRHR